MILKNVLCHLRDILLLPCSVVIVIPLLIYASTYHIIPGFLSIRILALTLSIPGLALFAWTNYLFQLIAKEPWHPGQRNKTGIRRDLINIIEIL